MDSPNWNDWSNRLIHSGQPDFKSLPAEGIAWRALLETRRAQQDGHSQAAQICEKAGLSSLAMQEWQLTLRDQPLHSEALERLASLHRDRGELTRARELILTLLNAMPTHSSALRFLAEILMEENNLTGIEPLLTRAIDRGFPTEKANEIRRGLPSSPIQSPKDDPFSFTDADCARFVTIFAARENLYARQWSAEGGKTGYTPVNEPFTPAVAKNHFQGSVTIGVYPIRLDGTCTFFAIDLDINKAALEKAARGKNLAQDLRLRLKAIAFEILNRLRILGFNPLFEHSGYKGRHYWVFLDQPEAAGTLLQLGRLLLNWLAPLLSLDFHLEFFPKQGELKGKGLGNLIKVPLGIHRRTGHRAWLLDDEGQPLPNPWQALRSITRHPRGLLIDILDRLKTTGSIQPIRHDGAGIQNTNTNQPTGLPLPLRVEVGWTEADFTTDTQVAHLMNNCPVLANLRQRAENDRTLSLDEQLVLIHTLGHLPTGPAAVNHLLGKCLDVGPEKYMKDRLKGSPTSCPTIRKRIPLITRNVRCCCDFSSTPDRYPNPLLHMLTLPEKGPETPIERGKSLGELAASLILTSRKIHDLQNEEALLNASLLAALRLHPSRALALEGGAFVLVESDGVEELTWQPTVGSTPSMGCEIEFSKTDGRNQCDKS